MISYWFHNITKNIYNESDLGDFVESVEVGDVIKFTENGRSIIFDFHFTNKYEEGCDYSGIREEFFEAWGKYLIEKND
jgi:hypothetical protein